MTYQPGHGHPHTRFARACAGLSRGLAWVYDHTAGVFHYAEDWAEATDDNGHDVSNLVSDVELPRRDGRTWEEYAHDIDMADDGRTVAEAVRDAEADEDMTFAERRRAENWRLMHAPGGTSSYFPYPGQPDAADDVLQRPGPGPLTEAKDPRGSLESEPLEYFHDDAPAQAIQTVPVGGVYLPLTDDTIVNLRPEPRAGASAWTAQLRRNLPPRRHPAWVQRILDAPIGDVHAALRAPDPDAYLWGCSQRRELEMA